MLALHSVASGGMETYCIDLAAEFVRRDIAVTAIVPASAALDLVAQRFDAAGAAVVRMETTAGRGRAAQLREFLPMMRLLRSLRPDAVHINVPGGKGGLVLAAAARLATSAVVVITEHEVPAERAGSRQRIVHRMVERVAHATLAVSRRNASLRRQRSGARERTFGSILNGVPIDATPPETRAERREQIRAEFGIATDAVVIGCVVRLAANKGLPDLIRAFDDARQAHRCELLLVGDGPLRDELAGLTRQMNIEAGVHFAGEQRDPGPFYDAMDVFALAVPEGSMSIALLEAMARGLPPVITFCGPEEAVIDGETGLAAPPADPAGLGAVLTRMVAEGSLRERLGGAAAAHVRRHFSISRVADDVLCVYGTAKRGYIPARLRADAPPTARPGDRAFNHRPTSGGDQTDAATAVPGPRART